MTDLAGRELEIYGKEIFEGMGLVCIYPLDQARLQELDPAGPHSQDDHLELDYLIQWVKI